EYELKDIDILLDDYFGEEMCDDCGRSWFCFNESNKMGGDEITRISVRGTDGGDIYHWLGDLVATVDTNGKLDYKKEEKRAGVVAGDIFEVFRGFCNAKMSAAFPDVVEVRFRI
ncbi:hypothetical protein KJ855_02475, partial [Patescibacteria group bacterium]|nr:hypothetical protein [Patescibacteria group bacterium]